MTGIDVDRYLDRISFEGEISHDLQTLERLQRAHMTAVPFENLHVFYRVGTRTDTDWSVPKIVEEGRGGWCFENNGAFGALLDALGFSVLRLGAAVLLGGPSKTIDHLTLEVDLDEPWLVDVGFGDSFIRPLRLNTRGPQDGGAGTFEFFDSADGLTLTRHGGTGVPEPQYRFRRVHHELADFDAPSHHLQTTDGIALAREALRDPPPRWWSGTGHAPEGSPQVPRCRRGDRDPIADSDWEATLEQWFGMRAPPAGTQT